MSKYDKPLTVRRLKEIMNEIPDEMITNALVLVEHENGSREYSIIRTGQFHFVPNLTFTIAPNVHGLSFDATEYNPPEGGIKPITQRGED